MLPDIDKIRELVEMMITNDLVELSVRDGEQEIALRRSGPVSNDVVVGAVPQVVAPAVDGGGAGGNADGAESTVGGEVVPVDFVEIHSPMVGTFYARPDPESPPFVHVGSQVGPSSVVCVLEAMKVFSEIKAEASGTIERVLVEDGEAVEYGQPLFLVRPA